MSKRKLVSCGVVLVIALVLSLGAVYFYWTRGVYVSITNNTQSAVRRMEIAYTGGVIQIATLEPKASYAQYINPAGESILKLAWVDSSGTKHSHGVDTYLDPQFAGRVQIALEPDNGVSAIQKVRAGLIWRGPARRTYSLQGNANGVR